METDTQESKKQSHHVLEHVFRQCLSFSAALAKITRLKRMFSLFQQVMDSSMPLIGEHVEEDRQLIADMVVSRMTQTLTTVGSSPSPLRPWVRTGGIFQKNQSNQVLVFK